MSRVGLHISTCEQRSTATPSAGRFGEFWQQRATTATLAERGDETDCLVGERIFRRLRHSIETFLHIGVMVLRLQRRLGHCICFGEYTLLFIFCTGLLRRSLDFFTKGRQGGFAGSGNLASCAFALIAFKKGVALAVTANTLGTDTEVVAVVGWARATHGASVRLNASTQVASAILAIVPTHV